MYRGEKSYSPTGFGKLWTTPGKRCMKHHNPLPQYETRSGIEPGTFRIMDECSITDPTLVLELYSIKPYPPYTKYDLSLNVQ